ncbi:helix-turn-helix domain-containing protein [Streptomyces sp. LP05-1]|uniref:Helix-turn-helix domain-containing protein n=1 Tax=Streptomyces pyxinae TaxID=2970734 RepID=A0ABT2CE10_9ACTN|nr:helix-turn-helix domain-containing protein [Streptomyces sp. LP05-1]MCS0634996.1 helix-turn-helix domain-containing protein [Streptomyces sp. LP05-1]
MLDHERIGIGALLRAARQQAGRTRREQATLVQDTHGSWFDPDNIKRWETERRLPTPVWRPALARAYALTPDQIDRAVATSRRARRTKEGNDDVDRRRFMETATAALGALPGISRARDGIDTALTGTDAGDIAYLTSAAERHQGGYRGRSPDTVLAEMERDLVLLREVLTRPHPARQRAELARTTAGVAGLVAIIQHDRGDQADAHRWFTTAATAAREAGDRRLTAWVLARHAMVPLNYGAPAQALRLAQQARRAAGPTPTAPAALATAVCARALAAAGNHATARAAITEAENLSQRLDTTAAADTWAGYPPQKHLVHLSQAYTLLGDTAAAYAAQDTAHTLTSTSSVMTRALLTMDTATCHAHDGDHQTAADTATAVLTGLPPGFRTGLVHSRATQLCHTLTGRPHTQLIAALR